jgi:hypothetical protein
MVKEVIRVFKSPLSMDNLLRRLTTLKPRWNLSMLLLAFVSSTRGFAFA